MAFLSQNALQLLINFYISKLISKNKKQVWQKYALFLLTKNIMFFFGDGFALPQELNPIIPHLTDRRMKSIDFINFSEKNK